MRCANCGKEIQEYMVFCPGCGTRVSLPPEQDALDTADVSVYEADREQTEETEESTRVMMRLLYAVIAVLFILAALSLLDKYAGTSSVKAGNTQKVSYLQENDALTAGSSAADPAPETVADLTSETVGDTADQAQEEQTPPDTAVEIPVGTPVVDLSEGYRIPEYVPQDRTTLPSYYHDYDDNEVFIYNTIALDKYTSLSANVNMDEIRRALNNARLPEDLKPIVAEFAQTMMETYPGIDMRCFLNNLEYVKVNNIEDQKNPEYNVDDGVEAWFSIEGLTPYLNVSKSLDPQEGNHDMIVLRHELGHMMNFCRFRSTDTKGRKFLYCDMMRDGFGFYVREGCNVIVTTYPFQDRYDDENLGLPLVGNELRVILEATPGFDPRMLVSQDVCFLEKFLDEQNDLELPAHELFELLEAQSAEYYNDRSNSCYGRRNDYEKIYEYIGKLYVKNVFYDGMPREEVEYYRELLTRDLTKLLSHDRMYLVHTDVIDSLFDAYLAAHDM